MTDFKNCFNSISSDPADPNFLTTKKDQLDGFEKPFWAQTLKD
jgi:hypothetical protein